MEFGIGYIVAARIVAGTLDQGGFTLHAHDPARRLCERQGKVADPAVQVENTRGGGQLQELHGARDEGLIDGGVDLYEIRRGELELQPEPGQAITQRLPALRHRCAGRGPRQLRVGPRCLQLAH